MTSKVINVPPPGHIIDENGTLRKVLGALPITADGCVVGDRAHLWLVCEPHGDGTLPIAYSWSQLNVMNGPDKGAWALADSVESCYSTREAAEAAREVRP